MSDQIVMPFPNRKNIEISELHINKLSFVACGKQPIMVKFNDSDYCLLNEMDALALYEMLGEFLGKNPE